MATFKLWVLVNQWICVGFQRLQQLPNDCISCVEWRLQVISPERIYTLIDSNPELQPLNPCSLPAPLPPGPDSPISWSKPFEATTNYWNGSNIEWECCKSQQCFTCSRLVPSLFAVSLPCSEVADAGQPNCSILQKSAGLRHIYWEHLSWSLLTQAMVCKAQYQADYN